MAKNITFVEWSATGLPNSLTIDKDTGIISGTITDPILSADVSFTANVTVKTNYGEDTKAITIKVKAPESWMD